MKFLRVDATDTNGDNLHKDKNGIFHCQWNKDLSETILLIAVLDDQGDHQKLRLDSKIKDPDLYEFINQDKSEMQNSFLSNQDFPIALILRKKQSEAHDLACHITNTLHFTVMDDGKKVRKQWSENLFII